MKDSLKFLSVSLAFSCCMMFGSALSRAATNDPTPYTITGALKTTTGTPLVDVEIFAATYVNGTQVDAVNGVTDSNGKYTIHVFGDALWYLTPDCYSGTNNIGHQGCLCVDSEYVKIGSTNGTANFETVPYSESIDELDGNVYDENKNPVAGVTVHAVNTANNQTNTATTDINGFYHWFVDDETYWDISMDCAQLAKKGYECPATIKNVSIRDRNTCCQNFTLLPAGSTPPFFTGEVTVGTDWYWLGPEDSNTNGFGYFYTKDFPYIFHTDLGWEYFVDAANSSQGAYFYDFSDGAWWYTQPGLFPYMFDFKANAWMYCAPQTGTTDRYQSNPRWFLNMSTKAWGNHL